MEPNNLETPQTLKAKPAPPEAAGWHEYLRKQKEDSPQRLEEAAKFLAGMVAITLSIVATTLEKMLALNGGLTKCCLAVWLCSLVLAFLVVFPLPYKIVKESAESIAAMHRKTVLFKYRVLVLSMLLFVAALVMLLFIFFGNQPAVNASPVTIPLGDTLPQIITN
jgi:hypothetical protein